MCAHHAERIVDVWWLIDTSVTQGLLLQGITLPVPRCQSVYTEEPGEIAPDLVSWVARRSLTYFVWVSLFINGPHASSSMPFHKTVPGVSLSVIL